MCVKKVFFLLQRVVQHSGVRLPYPMFNKKPVHIICGGHAFCTRTSWESPLQRKLTAWILCPRGACDALTFIKDILDWQLKILVSQESWLFLKQNFWLWRFHVKKKHTSLHSFGSLSRWKHKWINVNFI